MELFNVPDPVLAITHEYQEVNGLVFRGQGHNLFEVDGPQHEINNWAAATGAVAATLEEHQKVAEDKLSAAYMIEECTWVIRDDDLQEEYDSKLAGIQAATDIRMLQGVSMKSGCE